MKCQICPNEGYEFELTETLKICLCVTCALEMFKTVAKKAVWLARAKGRKVDVLA